jgi:hypothetical protein
MATGVSGSGKGAAVNVDSNPEDGVPVQMKPKSVFAEDLKKGFDVVVDDVATPIIKAAGTKAVGYSIDAASLGLTGSAAAQSPWLGPPAAFILNASNEPAKKLGGQAVDVSTNKTAAVVKQQSHDSVDWYYKGK